MRCEKGGGEKVNVTISPSVLSGSVSAPPSKSVAHRALICAALAKGKSVLSGFSFCEDTAATVDCLKALGAEIEIKGDKCIVNGADIFGSGTLLCRESGSTLRFMLPLCMNGKKNTLKGSDRLLKRPLGIYEDICKNQDIFWRNLGEEIEVCGTLTPAEFELEGNVSSQFISGLLFALPRLENDSIIRLIPPIESRSYIELTLSVLEQFGIKDIQFIGNEIKIRGNQEYRPYDMHIEGDLSNAAFLEALRRIGNNISVENVPEKSLQSDRVYNELFDAIDSGRPTISLADCPDLGPVMMAYAALKNGAVFTHTERLKIKERDRGAAMKEELEKFGVSVEIFENSITVGSGIKTPTEPILSHNDHRIVMSCAVLCSVVGGKILGADAVNKSYPEFFGDVISLGLKVQTDETR